ncbi:VWA domain-containing protein [Corynebacterium hindlerae]|uniref:VWA domain-containing protein n=1 Tax=Corynebacterium hindlerae TaxID=699041 RepID=A0A7G5FI76_9CORY|nr:VWA domain-containing protein [Corynebacterium hindlerae]QMV86317.1 VWA domain-containing protein [Corynebacterium hindlerae]
MWDFASSRGIRGFSIALALFLTIALSISLTGAMAQTNTTITVQPTSVNYEARYNRIAFDFSAGQNMEITKITVVNSGSATFSSPNRFSEFSVNRQITSPTPFTSAGRSLTSNFTQPLKVTATDTLTLKWAVTRGIPNAGNLKVTIEGKITENLKPQSWAGNDTNGAFLLTATQGNSPTLTFTRTIDTDGTLAGYIEATSQFQNGYDVDGGKQSVLKIYDPQGHVLVTVQNVPGSQEVQPISGVDQPSNNWGGVRFKLPSEIKVPAGSRIEATVPYGFRNSTVTSPDIKSPTGPGKFTINFQKASNFQKPNQSGYFCLALVGDGPVSGFKLAPNSDEQRKITGIKGVVLVADGGSGAQTSVPGPFKIDYSPEDQTGSAYVRFPQAMTADQDTAMCVVLSFDANVDMTQNVGDHFTFAAERNLFPGETPRVMDPEQGWDTPTVANPKPVPRCGQNIAIVMDASNSVIVKQGVDAMSDAASNIVKALTGTATSIGVYNFGSNGTRFEDAKLPSTSIQDEEGANKVLTAIGKYNSNMKLPGSYTSVGQGATNWEGALKNIEDFNKQNPTSKYDVVYFLTDGYPTFSDSTPRGGAEDASAGMVHVSDVKYAKQAADRVKQQGTRIQPVLINVRKDFTEPTAKDSTAVFKEKSTYKAAIEAYRQAYGSMPAHLFLPWAQSQENTFVRDVLNRQDADIYTVGDRTLLGQGFGDPLASKRDPQPQPDNTRVVLNERDWSTWAVGERGPLQMGDVIAANGDSILATTFGDLKRVLAEVALASCAGTVTLMKSVIDAEENPVPSETLAGWEFKAHTPGGNFLVAQDDSRTNETSDITDESGSVTFHIETDNPSANPEVQITESKRNGYSLFRQTSASKAANARCSINYLDGQPAQEIEVNDVGDEGNQDFQVSVKPGAVVICKVVNQKEPENGFFRVDKVDMDGKPLDDARFEVWQASGPGTERQGTGPVWKTGDESKIKLAPGKYLLIETQAPRGYSLLPEAIQFEIVAENGQQIIKLPNAGNAVFVLNSGSDESVSQGFGTYMQVADVQMGTLPKTGGGGIALWVVLGLLLVGAGWLAVGRREAKALH